MLRILFVMVALALVLGLILWRVERRLARKPSGEGADQQDQPREPLTGTDVGIIVGCCAAVIAIILLFDSGGRDPNPARIDGSPPIGAVQDTQDPDRRE